MMNTNGFVVKINQVFLRILVKNIIDLLKDI